MTKSKDIHPGRIFILLLHSYHFKSSDVDLSFPYISYHLVLQYPFRINSNIMIKP
ncbi:predicted protein [Botrytis cinerea T4]|uniref:Uncharacterized protein n=1 Tax=Botryotinia fuckeliana (strain T4) TaxID=999810 RepID=G2YMJ7_BOTF4|nr:predicted protein [Botrytis cinerea T4]